MKSKPGVGAGIGSTALLAALVGHAAWAQEIPPCGSPEVLAVASEAVLQAHANSNFAGLGTENKVLLALKNLARYTPQSEVDPTIEMLAAKAEYGPENIRACVTSEWGFRERAVVFIMLSPDDAADWGLFMVNVALDLPVASGWLLEPPPGGAAGARGN